MMTFVLMDYTLVFVVVLTLVTFVENNKDKDKIVDFLDTLIKDMGVEELLEIYSGAYDRAMGK